MLGALFFYFVNAQVAVSCHKKVDWFGAWLSKPSHQEDRPIHPECQYKIGPVRTCQDVDLAIHQNLQLDSRDLRPNWRTGGYHHRRIPGHILACMIWEILLSPQKHDVVIQRENLC